MNEWTEQGNEMNSCVTKHKKDLEKGFDKYRIKDVKYYITKKEKYLKNST